MLSDELELLVLSDELESLVSEVYLYADEIPTDRKYDVAFVTNPTSMHYETVKRFSVNTDSFSAFGVVAINNSEDANNSGLSIQAQPALLEV